jgi:two-component system copper resistance phosphate regulon response regulator CusR
VSRAVHVKLLLLEDDAALRQELVRVLRGAGWAVDTVTTLNDADVAASVGRYACFVFDRMVADGDAVDLVAVLRRRSDTTPALLVTARDTVADRVGGFEHGADDYLVKPFAREELIARIRALSRRGPVPTAQLLYAGDVELDVQRHTVHRDGVLLSLRAKEFAVLHELLREPGAVLTRTDLIERCWDEMHDPASNVVDAVVAQLRRSLGTPNLIETLRGVGYRIGPSA